MSVADTVVVMDHGRIEQVGPPRTIYNAPATSFVARFIGVHNTLPLEIFGMTTTATTPVLYAPGTVTTGVSFLVTMLCLFFISLFTIDRQRASSHCQGWSTSVQLSGNSTEDLLYGLRSVGLPIQGFGDIQEQYSQFVDDGLLALHLAPHGRMGARCDCISQNSEIGITGTAVSKAAILDETSPIRAVSFAARLQQYIAVEFQHLDRVLRSLFVDALQILPR